jgi:hypothetical protein
VVVVFAWKPLKRNQFLGAHVGMWEKVPQSDDKLIMGFLGDVVRLHGCHILSIP